MHTLEITIDAQLFQQAAQDLTKTELAIFLACGFYRPGDLISYEELGRMADIGYFTPKSVKSRSWAHNLRLLLKSLNQKEYVLTEVVRGQGFTLLWCRRHPSETIPKYLKGFSRSAQQTG